MKRKKRLIDLHHEWSEAGKIKNRSNTIGAGGLCNAVPVWYYDDLKEIFEPDEDEYQTYWASLSSRIDTSDKALYRYNSLRQTIVLLICAMKGEL